MSMTGTHKALYMLWSSFGVPAYLAGHVPEGAEFPYITFSVSAGDAMEQDVLAAFNWHRAAPGVNVNMERAALMDRIAAAIPSEGVLIPTGDGRLFVYRNSAGFQQYYDDPEDAAIIGGRTSYIISFLTV